MPSASDIAYFIHVLRWIGRTALVSFAAGVSTLVGTLFFGPSVGTVVLQVAIAIVVLRWAYKTYPANPRSDYSRRV